MRPRTWLGDLARCLHELRPEDSATARAIASSLGLALHAPEPGFVPERRPPEPPARTPPERKPDVPVAAVAPPAPEGLRLLSPVEPQAAGERPWAQAATFPSEAVAAAAPPRLHRTLFGPSRERELTVALASAWTAGGEVDADALVTTIAAGRPVTRLPRLPRRVLAANVQLLLDLGEGMEPFGADREALARQVPLALGAARVHALRFRGSPLHAGAGPVWTWTRYAPPAPGATVIAVSDLGIGGPPLSLREAGPADWLELAGVVRRAGCRLVALTPYGRARRPGPLRRAFPIVEWDRRTGVADVLRALEAAR